MFFINHNTPYNQFDYIIAGAGCAGLSLLLRILQQPSLQQKKILLIDNDAKKTNDRTWCFWEKKPGIFENIVHHSWPQLVFNTPNKKIDLSIQPYTYKMIRGQDFYAHAFATIQQNSNITFLQANVEYVHTNSSQAFVIANQTTYYAQYVFNSIVFQEDKEAYNSSNAYKLIQHFKGWVIETEQPVFNTQQAYFMDFRVPQTHDTTFVYVLPTAPNKALVEYTFFNTQLLPTQAHYNVLLQQYLQQFWQLSQYNIVEEEFGSIPMSNFAFTTHKGYVINIGTAGGYTKPSSGFTFMFIQKHTAAIAEKLAANQFPLASAKSRKKFLWYDTTLLNVLIHKKMGGGEIFEKMFSKLPAHLVLQFLDNETNLLQDVGILASVPTSIFFPAATKEIKTVL